MPKKIQTVSPRRASAHLPELAVRFADMRRGSSSQRGYDGRWQKARRAWLARHPLCACCEANGYVQPAEVVDHVVPHKGDRDLFWDSDNWQPLCAWCHNAVKQPIEAAFIAGRVAVSLLRLDREVPGWQHPADRGRGGSDL